MKMQPRVVHVVMRTESATVPGPGVAETGRETPGTVFQVGLGHPSPPPTQPISRQPLT